MSEMLAKQKIREATHELRGYALTPESTERIMTHVEQLISTIKTCEQRRKTMGNNNANKPTEASR